MTLPGLSCALVPCEQVLFCVLEGGCVADRFPPIPKTAADHDTPRRETKAARAKRTMQSFEWDEDPDA